MLKLLLPLLLLPTTTLLQLTNPEEELGVTKPDPTFPLPLLLTNPEQGKAVKLLPILEAPPIIPLKGSKPGP
uniref:Uncharacterized protein MANES_02G038400 n=1 Tax=Rhizophora mucronata TaxID=61149 RepID=A0A2P2QXB7_RHIMU